MKKKPLDPYAYIENAFLDRPKDEEADLPKISSYLSGKKKRTGKYQKTEMRAPRPRVAEHDSNLNPRLTQVLEQLPKTVTFLSSVFDDEVTAHYYVGEFKETREEMIERLLDPQLSLEETSRILGVCPATVRRYTNRGWLNHHRTSGGQRRFKLSDIVMFVDKHGRFPKAS
jgi:hypothetical protein